MLEVLVKEASENLQEAAVKYVRAEKGHQGWERARSQFTTMTKAQRLCEYETGENNKFKSHLIGLI